MTALSPFTCHRMWSLRMDEFLPGVEEQTGGLVEPPIAIKRVAGMLVAGIRCHGDLSTPDPAAPDLSDPDSAGTDLSVPDTLFELLRREAGGQICGPALYLHHARGSEIECCYPVMGVVESGMIRSQRLPGGEVLSLVHYGPCSRLGESWGVLFDYIERNNIPVAGPWREIYLDGRVGWGGDQRIELQAPLLKDRANGQ